MGSTQQDDLFLENKTLEERFIDFHKRHPEFYGLFKRFTFQIIERGIPHYSAYAIGHVIRWHSALRTGEDFKLNNNYIPFYARKFIRDHPEHASFFFTRRQRHQSNTGSLSRD